MPSDLPAQWASRPTRAETPGPARADGRAPVRPRTQPAGQGVTATAHYASESSPAAQGCIAGEQGCSSLFAQHPDGVFQLDRKGRLVTVNAACSRVWGYTAAEVLQRPLTSLVMAEHTEQVLDFIRRALRAEPQRAEFAFRHRDGQRVDVELTAVPIVPAGKTCGLYGVARDMTAQKQAQEALQHRALHDALTGLPNRMLLRDRLEQALHIAQREHHPLALLLLDLDNFKEVNDTFGHQHGDILLQEVAARLQGVLRLSDTVARLGGDEFAVLLPGDDPAGAEAAARKVRAALDEPIVLEDALIRTQASIGGAIYPLHGTQPQTLLRRADVAMYVAKRSRSGYASYAPEHDHHSRERLSLIADLHQAIARDELQLHYQPKVDLTTRRLDSVEALVRWRHPARGLIMPERFIPLAEQSNLMGPLTAWVLDAALRQCQAWWRQGLRIGVEVNLSMANLRNARLNAIIGELLSKYQVAPGSLHVELTESTIMADADLALDVLGRLAQMGLHIAVDDFGTGYSSLAYLKRLPVDELKIDKSFVLQMVTNHTDAIIVRSTIGLGHSLGLRVVAEGVETRKALDMLAGMGCDAAQGYFLSRPRPAPELTPWLEFSSWPPQKQFVASGQTGA